MSRNTLEATALKESDAAESAGEERGAVLQLVAVCLGDESYALGIEGIEGVIAPRPITRVPCSPEHVAGVINLRGRIIPIVDLRARFGLPPAPPEIRSRQRIVIVTALGNTAGLIVDSVSDVLRLPESRVEPPSFLVAAGQSDCITGIGRVGADRLVVLLDTKGILAGNPAEEAMLSRLSQTATAA